MQAEVKNKSYRISHSILEEVIKNAKVNHEPGGNIYFTVDAEGYFITFASLKEDNWNLDVGDFMQNQEGDYVKIPVSSRAIELMTEKADEEFNQLWICENCGGFEHPMFMIPIELENNCKNCIDNG